MRINKKNQQDEETNEGGKFLKPEKPEKVDNQHINGIAGAIFAILFGIAIVGAIAMDNQGIGEMTIGIYFSILAIIAMFFLFSLKVSNQWEKAVILRFGKFHGLRGREFSGYCPSLILLSIGLTNG